MKIGILGSGNIGGSLGRLWAKAGHEICFASRSPDSLAPLVAQAGAGARAGTLDEATAFAEVILEALPFSATMKLSAEALAGKALISAANYYPPRDGEVDLGGLSQTEALARHLPRTTLVKAFNMMFATAMAARANGPGTPGRAIFLAGDDADAKSIAARLIETAHFVPIDAGPLRNGRYFENGAPLYAKLWDAETAKAELAALETKA